jgi:peptidyl-prolyl cis-trans isomerase SurA
MKRRLYFSVIAFGAFVGITFAQFERDLVLFTVGKDTVMTSEFIKGYNKNLNLIQDEGQKDVEEYLRLYQNYQLKLQQARDLNLDQKEEYINEFNRYKKQLSATYLTDTEISEQMVQEAYQRTVEEVNVDHILVVTNNNTTDTIGAYNEALKYRDLLIEENDFEAIKTQVHNGKTVFAERLGYFSAFKVVYPFESVAYNTPVGDVSMPFKTQFGYHVLRVNNKRPSYQLTAAHILISDKKQDSLFKPEKRINEIYNLFKAGQKFEDLAKQFSEDKNTASKGGKLNPFKAGQLGSSLFEEETLKLNPGEVSKPFKTQYGWHIVKLIEKKEPDSFENLKSALETKVKRDARSRIIDQSFVEDLKKRYNVPQYINLSYFEQIINDSIYKNKWTVPVDLPQDKLLCDFGDRKITYSDFANYIQANQRGLRKQDNKTLVSSLFQEFIRKKLIAYHEDNLENVNSEYAQILDEFRDGLLLFDVMQEKIWNAVDKDTLALKEYYLANRSKYMWPERVEANIFSSPNEVILRQSRQALIEGKSVEDIKQLINTKNNQNLITTSGVFAKNYQAFPSEFPFSIGVSEVYEHNNAFCVVAISKIIPRTPKEFDEIKGTVINDYQEKLEREWIEELKDKYEIKVNKKALRKVKNYLK